MRASCRLKQYKGFSASVAMLNHARGGAEIYKTYSCDDITDMGLRHWGLLLVLCRSYMTDEQLVQVLGQHPALEKFKVSSCPRISDEGLAALPASTLQRLRLVCCDGIVGTSLGRLKQLERLEFTSCHAVTGDAIQASATFRGNLFSPAHRHGRGTLTGRAS